MTTRPQHQPTEPASARPTAALIIGGGIAGPVVAMFLQRAGIAPVIYEGQPGPADETGAFLNLAPNGLAVLETLGVAGEIIARGTPTTSIEFLNHRGRRLGVLPEATLLIRRGSLNRALREAAAARGIRFEFGKRLVEVRTPPNGGVSARFEDGTEARGDLLVGCDGIHSATRRAIMPDAPGPEYTGVIDSGGFAPAPLQSGPDGVMRMIFGLHGFFGYQVVPSGQAFWFENFHEPSAPERGALEAVPDLEWRRRLLETHVGDPQPVSDIIWSAAEPIGRWPIYDLPTLPAWHRGPVCLIGDAAHATSPHAGQGASLALEDAIVLGRCLRDIPNLERAFATFEAQRRPRVEKLVREARRQGRRKAAGSPLSRRVRDLVLPFFLELGVRNLRKIYAYRVDWAERAANVA
ncbi:MAG: FAD-dependent monooxygenase [Gemmatimonadales bacterium]|nr:FAD-dependent monooxygenase [Gemmatimonadales bacterium]